LPTVMSWNGGVGCGLDAIAYSIGSTKPRRLTPCWRAYWSIRAMAPAQNGAAALVPPTGASEPPV